MLKLLEIHNVDVIRNDIHIVVICMKFLLNWAMLLLAESYNMSDWEEEQGMHANSGIYWHRAAG